MMTAGTGESAVLVLPAVLHGQRVDFFEASEWETSCPGEQPAAGYWRERSSGRLLVALDEGQALRVAAAVRRLGKRLRLGLKEAKAAEAGRALAWTSRLNPVPAGTAVRLTRDTSAVIVGIPGSALTR